MNLIIWLICITVFVLSGCSAPPNKARYTIDQAVKDGYVVASLGRYENINKLERFVEMARLHEIAEVRTVRYTEEGDPTFITLKTDRNQISYTHDISLDEFAGPVRVEEDTCGYIKKSIKVKGASYQLKDCRINGDIEVLYTSVSHPNELPEALKMLPLSMDQIASIQVIPGNQTLDVSTQVKIVDWLNQANVQEFEWVEGRFELNAPAKQIHIRLRSNKQIVIIPFEEGLLFNFQYRFDQADLKQYLH